MRKILLFATVLSTFLFFQSMNVWSSTIKAQDENEIMETTIDDTDQPTLVPTSEAVEEKVTTTLSGEVVKIEGDKMTLKTDDGEIKEVIIANDAQIKVNTRPGKLEDIDVDDKVKLTLTDEEVIIVESTDNNVANLKVILPVALGGLLLLGIIVATVSKNANKGEIKTTPTKLD